MNTHFIYIHIISDYRKVLTCPYYLRVPVVNRMSNKTCNIPRLVDQAIQNSQPGHVIHDSSNIHHDCHCSTSILTFTHTSNMYKPFYLITDPKDIVFCFDQTNKHPLKSKFLSFLYWQLVKLCRNIVKHINRQDSTLQYIWFFFLHQMIIPYQIIEKNDQNQFLPLYITATDKLSSLSTPTSHTKHLKFLLLSLNGCTTSVFQYQLWECEMTNQLMMK